MNYNITSGDKSLELKHYIFALHIVIVSMPVFIWPIVEFSLVLSLLVFVLSFRAQLSILKLQNLMFFMLALVALFVYKSLLGSSLFGALFFSFSVSVLLLVNSDHLLRAFSAFKKTLAFLIVPGLIIWTIQVLTGNWDLLRLGILPDEYVMHQHKVESGHKYILYPFLTRIEWANGSTFYRFQSFFNEPGYLGTICALIFISSKGSIKRVEDKVIFLAGVLSFSLAFYLLIFIFIFLSVFSQAKKILPISLMLFVVIVLASIAFPQYLEERVIKRVQFTETGLAGDNRSSDNLSDAFAYWTSQATEGEILFGVEGFRSDGSSSILQIPVLTGLVGVLSLIFIYGLFALKYSFLSTLRFAAFIFIFMFFLSAYQRPQIENPIYVFIFISGFLISLKSSKNTEFQI